MLHACISLPAKRAWAEAGSLINRRKIRQASGVQIDGAFSPLYLKFNSNMPFFSPLTKIVLEVDQNVSNGS